MNQPMPLPSVHACLCVLALFAGASQAQDPSGSPPDTPEVTFDLTMKQASLADACALIADQYETKTGKALNIVVSSLADTIILPDMKLREVTLDQFSAFLNQTGEDPRTMFGADSQRPIPSFGMEEANGIWRVWVLALSQEQTQTQPVIFDLGDDAEEAMGLIDEMLKDNAAPGTKLKFHEPSRALIVQASTEDLAKIQEVVYLYEQRNENRNATQVDEGKKAAHDAIVGLREDYTQLAHRFEETYLELEKHKSLLHEMEAKLAKAENERQAAMAEREAVLAEMEKLKAQKKPQELIDPAPWVPPPPTPPICSPRCPFQRHLGVFRNSPGP